jgi:dipeptidyl aminopeptidase/acylaminoacyl peptidase
MDAGESINRDAIDVTGARIQEILFPDEVASHTAALYRIYVLKLGPGRSSIHLVPQYKLLKIPILSSIYPFNASPDGKRLVDLEPVTAVPTSWTRYIPAPGAEHLRFRASSDSRLFRTDNVLRPMQYTLIDLMTGRELPLLGAPNARTLGYTADRNQAAWSPDGDRLVVTNTFLSIPAQGSENLLPCGAAVVELKSLRRNCLYVEDGKRQSEAPRIQDIGFGKRSDEVRILLRSTNGTETIRAYVFQRGEWAQASSQAVDAQSTKLTGGMQPASVQVFVRQSLNDPPVLRARDRIGHECELWDPNPELRHMRFGQASLYEWKDDTGRPWSGILVKPVDYRSDVRYPLVLQLYNYRPGEFLTDGLEPTAFAARELADAGFVVLQIRKQADTVTDQDAQIHLEGYASAIERLSQEGLVDRTRVGVVGFSLTCWYVVNALIKQPNLFRAATIADGLDNSYMQYMLFAVESYTLQRQMDQIRGAPPIGPALERWVAEAPGFNLDRVQTPVRIEAMGPSSVLQEWELYSSLRLQEKPVDLIYFPMGQHIHQVPLERLESQQGDIDWFRFWLKNEEDLDPGKRPQYQRWEAMRSGTEYRANMTQ